MGDMKALGVREAYKSKLQVGREEQIKINRMDDVHNHAIQRRRCLKRHIFWFG